MFVLFKRRCAITTGTVTVKQAGPLLTVTRRATEAVWTVALLTTASGCEAAPGLGPGSLGEALGSCGAPSSSEATPSGGWSAGGGLFARFHLQTIPVTVLGSGCCTSLCWDAGEEPGLL